MGNSVVLANLSVVNSIWNVRSRASSWAIGSFRHSESKLERNRLCLQCRSGPLHYDPRQPRKPDERTGIGGVSNRSITVAAIDECAQHESLSCLFPLSY